MVKFSIPAEVFKKLVDKAVKALDSGLNANLKMLILEVHKGFVNFATYGYVLSYYDRTSDVTVESEGLIGLPTSIVDIASICASKNVNTFIDEITFTEMDKHIVVTALEKGVADTPLQDFQHELKWVLNKMETGAVIRNVSFGILDCEIPDTASALDGKNAKLMIDIFSPLLTKGDFRQLSSYVFISNEKVYSVTGSSAYYIKNIFERIHDISLNGKLLSFINELISNTGTPIYMWEEKERLVFEIQGSYVTYNLQRMKIFDISHYLSDSNYTTGSVVSFEMLNNMIKRANITGDKTINMNFSENEIVVETQSFNMVLPVLKFKNLTGKYQVDLQALSQAIILDKDNFAKLYVYSVNNSYRLAIHGESGFWGGDISIKKV